MGTSFSLFFVVFVVGQGSLRLKASWSTRVGCVLQVLYGAIDHFKSAKGWSGIVMRPTFGPYPTCMLNSAAAASSLIPRQCLLRQSLLIKGPCCSLHRNYLHDARGCIGGRLPPLHALLEYLCVLDETQLIQQRTRIRLFCSNLVQASRPSYPHTRYTR